MTIFQMMVTNTTIIRTNNLMEMHLIAVSFSPIFVRIWKRFASCLDANLANEKRIIN